MGFGASFMHTKTQELQLLHATVSDAAAIVAHQKTIFAQEAHLISTPEEYHGSVWQQRSWIQHKIKNPLTCCLLVKAGPALVGMLYNWSDPRARVRHVTSFTMTVDANHRRRGIGRLLLGSFMGYVQNHKILEKIELHVHSDNAPALALYKDMGFVQEGVRKHAIKYEDGRIIDDILMACWPAQILNKSFTDYIEEQI